MNIAKDVTLITTTYNDEKYIGSYLENIFTQTILPSKIIIVDGGSKDATENVINEYKYKTIIPIDAYFGKRLNIAQAFNEGIKLVSTQYVIITCTGNKFPNDMIEKLYSNIDNCYAAYGIMKGVFSSKFSKLYNDTFLNGEQGCKIMSNRCVIYKAQTFDLIGLFKENFIYAGEDSEFLYRFIKNNLTRKSINSVTVYWETPNTFNSYMKKAKYYSISGLQWQPLSSLLIEKRLLLQITYILLFIIGFFFWKSFVLLVFLLALDFIFHKKSNKCLTFKGFSLLNFNTLLKFYYRIKYIKYAQKEYRA